MPLDPLPPPPPHAAQSPSLQDLHKAIHAVKLPKSNISRTCLVPLEDWKTIRSLVAALLQIPSPPANSDTSDGISSLSSKLDALVARLDSIAPQNPQTSPTSGPLPPKSYASVAALPSATSPAHSHAPRNTTCDITLTPKDRRHKAFANETHHAIQQQLNAFISGSARLNEYAEVPFVRAAAKHHNGDVRLTLQSTHAARLLSAEADYWLPAFSSLLCLRTPTFPVVMHRVPTDFEVGGGALDGEDEQDNDILHITEANKAHVGFGDLNRVHWIGRRTGDDLRKVKKHSSLVLHFTSPEAANKCIEHRLALHGHLHRTEKYREVLLTTSSDKELLCFHVGGWNGRNIVSHQGKDNAQGLIIY
ncbi:hypothetical protein C8R46DRAFT_1004503 [Mycena filopes]|nr:hypothetical protein C8R46DRAFT_1004503 [Mycena filopes]